MNDRRINLNATDKSCAVPGCCELGLISFYKNEDIIFKLCELHAFPLMRETLRGVSVDQSE